MTRINLVPVQTLTDLHDGILSETPWYRYYLPTPQALTLVRARIQEKIMLKPTWYKLYGHPFFSDPDMWAYPVKVTT